MKFGKGYTQLQPLQQNQVFRVTTVNFVYIHHFIKYTAEGTPDQTNKDNIGSLKGSFARNTAQNLAYSHLQAKSIC